MARMRNLEEAYRLIRESPHHATVESWTSIMNLYTELGHSFSALSVFREMQEEGMVNPSKDTFLCVLKVCARLGSLEKAHNIHDSILRNGFELDPRIRSSLVYLYAKCHSLVDAQKVFDGLNGDDVAAWNALIGGYAQHGHLNVALEFYQKSVHVGIVPNKVTFLYIIKVCSLIGAFPEGRIIHDHICQCGMEGDLKLGSSLVDFYAKCGSLSEASHVFDHLPRKNVVSWDAIISGYAQHGQASHAFEAFHEMQKNGVKPIKMTFLALLKACDSVRTTVHGRRVHDQIVKHDLIFDVEIGNTLVHMYSKWGSLKEACGVFNSLVMRTVVSWSSLIDGFVRQGQPHSALRHFMQMQEEGVVPDEATFSSALRACKSAEFVDQGKLLHDKIIRRDFDIGFILGTTIVDMYAKIGYLSEARCVLDNMPTRNVVSWGAMISGYTTHGFPDLAIETFLEMQHQGLKSDKSTFVCTLKSCTTLGGVHTGMLLHHNLMVESLESDVLLGTSLIDMYAKSGCLAEARRVFDTSVNRDIITWGTLIGGYTHCEEHSLALDCLNEMQMQGMRPVDAIYTSILSGCGYTGRLADGQLHFHYMTEDLNIKPSIEQYGCMADLLAKVGSLDEAKDILHAMPIVPDTAAWTSLISGCEAYGHVVLGRQCFHEMYHKGTEIKAANNILTMVNNHTIEKAQIPKVDNHVGVHKCLIEDVENSYNGSTSRQEIQKKASMAQIDLILGKLIDSTRGRSSSLCRHCERLASALGLVSSYSRERTHSSMYGVCISCRNTIQALSRVERRETIARKIRSF